MNFTLHGYVRKLKVLSTEIVSTIIVLNKRHMTHFIFLFIVPLVVSTSGSFSHSYHITGFVTRLTRPVPLVVQELLTLHEDQSSSLVFSGVRVARSLVLCACFVDSFLSSLFWPLCCQSFSNCGFWLPLWYLLALLVSDLRRVGGFLLVLRFPPPIKLTATL